MDDSIRTANYNLPNYMTAKQYPTICVDKVIVKEIVVERKKGEWCDRGSLSCRCSRCRCKSPEEFSFCPNCGADMRGDKRNE